VETLLEFISVGRPIDEILSDYEDLELDDLLAMLFHATQLHREAKQ